MQGQNRSPEGMVSIICHLGLNTQIIWFEIPNDFGDIYNQQQNVIHKSVEDIEISETSLSPIYQCHCPVTAVVLKIRLKNVVLLK